MKHSKVPSNAVYRLVGERIRCVRHERCMTQERLGELVKLQRTSITNIEKGRQKVLLHTFIEIASVLGVSPGELLSSVGRYDTLMTESNRGEL